MPVKKYWLISEKTVGDYYHYSGYYKRGKPLFTIAIADAIHIASFENAKTIFEVLNKIVPCEVLLVKNHTVTRVFPSIGLL